MRKSGLFTILFLVTICLNAQTGRVSGSILDSKTGETLPGAQVMIENSTRGASADFDGKFVINNVPVGKVTLVISYISYTTKKVTGVAVVAGEVTDVNIQLDPSTSQDLNEVEVVVTLNKENNTALVLQQKNNASVSDGISAETIKRTPDRNTSDVLRRVSGASIQDNKFAIVRGLNDRYNAAYLNGAPLPSTESDRKAFSFDLFPSNMLDNLVITKTARPDLPGEFAGGIIEINTKNIPEKNFLLVSAGCGYNTITTGKERLYYNGGKTDWLGRDDGTRAISNEIPAYENFPSDINEQASLAKRVKTSDWGIYNKKFAPNSSYQISGGYNFKRKEQDFFGILGSLSYNNTNSFFTTKRYVYQGIQQNVGEAPILDKDYFDRTFQNQKLIGGLLNASCKLNENNSISVKNLYSIFSDDRVIERTGTTTPLEKNPLLVKSTAMWFTQNTALTTQLIGDHYIPKAKIKIAWNANYANVKREIPNLRRHTYNRLSFLEDKNTDPSEPPLYDPNDTIWKAQFTNSGSSGNEYSGVMMWSKLNESIYNTKLDASHTYKFNKNLTMETKIGGLYQIRNRDFDFRQFVYSEYGGSGGATTFSSAIGFLPTNQIFTQQNMGVITPSTSSSGQIGGFKLTETTLPQSSYQAGSNLTAAYLMVDLKYKSLLRLVTGARVENYTQRLSYFDNLYAVNKKIITQDTTVLDILPSANLIYSVNDKMNLRACYSKTINRPEFRELAPFLFYDFNTQFSLSGNPQLKRALIHNYDVRWEWYPGAGQLISVSGFHKKFINPIELSKQQNATAISYINIPSAICQGIELEARLNVGKYHKKDSTRIGKILDNLTVFSNLSLIKSQIERGNSGTFDLYDRPMQGQSPYVLNGGISYVDNKYDFSFSVMLNRVGPRIYVVGNDISPEIWELPRTGLDCQLTKSFIKKRLELRLNIKDILAASQPLRTPVNFDDAAYSNNSQQTAPLWNQTFGTTISFQVAYKF